MEPTVGKPSSASNKSSGSSPRTIVAHDPATGELLGELPALSADEVKQVVARARKAQESWRLTTFAERRRVLQNILDYLLDNADELVEDICRDAGKTRENALIGEIWPLCEKLKHTIATGEADLADEEVSSGMLLHKAAHIEFHPLGVIGVITPWNFPLQNILAPVIPALFAGNAVVVKVSEWVAWSAPRFQKLFDAVLGRTGHSKDLVQVINGYAEAGQALIAAPVDKIVFTGSMTNGKRVAEACAKHLVPVILELGGKDPMILCDDADVDQAAAAAMAGSFIASGQMCLAAERVYVHTALHDRFVAAVMARASQMRQGAPLAGELVDVGAMTMPGQVDIVEALVNDAIAKGARVLLGGKRVPGKGNFFQPTILDGVTDAMRIAQEETFGPVMCLLDWSDEDDVVTRANGTHYGLGSSVFSKNGPRAERIGRRLRAGSTVINDFSMAYMANALPFGGVGGSGYGRLNGKEGLRGMTNIKSVLTDRLPFHNPVWLYPVKQGDYARAKQTIEMLYRRGVGQKAAGLAGLVRGLFKK